jgi:hypothetical protein
MNALLLIRGNSIEGETRWQGTTKPSHLSAGQAFRRGADLLAGAAAGGIDESVE